MGKIRFQWEPCRRIYAEPNFPDLIRAHYAEAGLLDPRCPLDPDYNAFILREEQGMYRVWTARDGKTLVGYLGWYIQPHLHYKSTLHAVDDLYFLAPTHRKGLTGYRMFVSSLAELKKLGVVRCIVHSKIHVAQERGGLAPMFTRLGFEHTDNFFVKFL